MNCRLFAIRSQQHIAFLMCYQSTVYQKKIQTPDVVIHIYLTRKDTQEYDSNDL